MGSRDEARSRAVMSAPRPTPRPAPAPVPPPMPPAPLAHEYVPEVWCTAEEAFDAWCVGRTGAPVVDAGMHQLWVEGWMPRRVRLLCACCLTEGMGLDWRRGRDWFALTLIDHDPAINE